MARKLTLSPRTTAAQFERRFPSDDACRQYLAERRWPGGIACPRCDNRKVYPVTNRPFHWQCTRCAAKGGYRFSVLVGSPFENTNIGLKTWFKIIHLMLTSKESISTLEIQRMMAFGSYSTAQNACRRVRAALADREFRKLMAIVGFGKGRANKTAIRRPRQNGSRRKAPLKRAGKGSGKVAVAGAARRKSRPAGRASSRAPRG